VSDLLSCQTVCFSSLSDIYTHKHMRVQTRQVCVCACVCVRVHVCVVVVVGGSCARKHDMFVCVVCGVWCVVCGVWCVCL